jgi:hypothetical protein
MGIREYSRKGCVKSKFAAFRAGGHIVYAPAIPAFGERFRRRIL